jgi:hypothetical protein
MTAQPARRRVKAATLALAGIAMLATTACATASAATSGKSAESAGQRSSSVPIVVNCGGQTLRRPNIYLLECADGYAFVGGLTWSTWGSSSALASGTSHFNDCTPNCLSGRGHTFPALVVLWRARARPGHAGVRYFSEMTIIYTGNRSYTAGGKKTQVPQAQTILLSPNPGAGPLPGIRTSQDHGDDLARHDDQPDNIVARVTGAAGWLSAGTFPWRLTRLP